MSSYTITETKSFTLTHARHLAAKVATDLRRIQRIYGGVTDQDILDYEKEATELMRLGYLDTVAYGFRRNGQWIEPTLRYSAKELATEGVDDDPGRIRIGADIAGAVFYSYLTYSPAWQALSSAEQENIKRQLPFQRTGAPEPSVEGGYFADDKTYSAGGRSLSRASVRRY